MIIVDNREFKGKIIRELFKKGFDITPKQLSIGDYIIGDVCIERKGIKDFYDSIIDKRIFEQLRILKSSYEKRLLIIEGEGTGRNIHPNAVKGLIASIIIDYKTPVIFSKNAEETAEFLGIVEKRMQKSVTPVINIKKEKSELDLAINLLCNIPGIGLKTAAALIEEHKSLKKVFSLSLEELKKTLGNKLGEKVFGFINNEF